MQCKRLLYSKILKYEEYLLQVPGLGLLVELDGIILLVVDSEASLVSSDSFRSDSLYEHGLFIIVDLLGLLGVVSERNVGLVSSKSGDSKIAGPEIAVSTNDGSEFEGLSRGEVVNVGLPGHILLKINKYLFPL